jgi:hypothetical protein
MNGESQGRQHGAETETLKKLMNLNGLMLDREYFFEFMGYYLSEGSTCKRSSGELLQTSIHQKDNETRQNIFVCAKKKNDEVDKTGKVYLLVKKKFTYQTKYFLIT